MLRLWPHHFRHLRRIFGVSGDREQGGALRTPANSARNDQSPRLSRTDSAPQPCTGRDAKSSESGQALLDAVDHGDSAIKIRRFAQTSSRGHPEVRRPSMFEFNYPTVYPVEPSGLRLLLTGTLTLLGYLVVTGKWRQVCSIAYSESKSDAFEIPTDLAAPAVYPICEYEIHFAYTLGNGMNAVPPPKSRPGDVPVTAV